LEGALDLARQGRLYPSLILHGSDEEGRRRAAIEIARTALCAEEPAQRPCGRCRQCRRLQWPDAKSDTFHPDLHVLERDLKTSTSVDATKRFLAAAQLSPFEARGQVFIVANAETLTGEAANALLKSLEEPGSGAPRHFQLLAPSQFDLLTTLRSRSLALYLGAAEDLAGDDVTERAASFAEAVAAYAASGSAVYVLSAAEILASAGPWQDARAGKPWSLAARTVLVSLDHPQMPAGVRSRLLALAQNLLEAVDLRMRGIPAERILDGLLTRHLVGHG
jgi:DNA polymerase-3 subunit delta'